jgi:uncharacterized damage-inducible protein DinB
MSLPRSLPLALYELVVPAWNTDARVTEELVRALPIQVYRAPIPGLPRKTVRAMAVHIHNSRCGWLRTLGEPLGIRVPRRADPFREGRPALVRALRDSAHAMEALFLMAGERGGYLPASKRYVWRNLALDIGHLVTYFIAHEAHHRGQLLLIARQLGMPVPAKAADAVWWWKPSMPVRRIRQADA